MKEESRGDFKMKTDKEKIIEEVLKDMRREDNIVYDWILGEREDIYIEKAISLTYDKTREQTRQETADDFIKIVGDKIDNIKLNKYNLTVHDKYKHRVEIAILEELKKKFGGN